MQPTISRNQSELVSLIDQSETLHIKIATRSRCLLILQVPLMGFILVDLQALNCVPQIK